MDNTSSNAATTLRCLKHCNSRIDDVAASIVLRGGKPLNKGSKPPVTPKKRITTESQDIETLTEQQSWLRKNLSDLPKKFADNPAFIKSTTESMQASLKRSEETLADLLGANTYVDSLLSDNLKKLANSAASHMTVLLKGKFQKYSVTPINHVASDGKSYSTILISFRNVKTNTNTLPWLIFALSETQERQTEKRALFVTAMSSPSLTFTPRSKFKDARQLERQINMFLTQKNIDISAKPSFDIPRDTSLKGVLTEVHSSSVVNGKLIAGVHSKEHDPNKVAVEGAKTLFKIMREHNPKFDGNIQYTMKPDGSKHSDTVWITFSSQIKGSDKKVNPAVKKPYRMDEASNAKPKASFTKDLSSQKEVGDGKVVAFFVRDNIPGDVIDVKSTKDVASHGRLDINTFFSQLGHMSMAMIGAKDIVSDKKNDSFKFKIGGSKKVSHVNVKLNAKDLYDLTFFKYRSLDMKEISSASDVHVENLSKVFYAHTGLYTWMC